MGAASRKRKWELAAERGLVPRLGHSSAPDPYAHHGRAGGYPTAGRPAVPTSKFQGGAKGGGKGRQDPQDEVGAKRQRGVGQGKGAGKSAPAAVQFLQLSPEASFVQNGLPDLGPMVQHSSETSIQNCLWAVSDIMSAMGVTEESVTLTDDGDWSLHPEVGEAVKQATGQELSMTIAECADVGIWAVGVGGKVKQRNQAAKLAMCIALAANMDDFSSLAASQPEFTMLCESAGVATGTDLKEAQAERQANREKPARGGGKGGAKGAGKGDAKGGKGPADPTKDVPLWINVAEGEEPIPELLEVLSPEALAISSDGGRRQIYNRVDNALKYFVGESVDTEVEYHDDGEWKEFPAVGSAVKRLTKKEESQMVAVCATAGVWAVGVGNKYKSRQFAAKAALAATLALQHAELDQEIDYSEFPGLQQLVEEAQVAKDAAVAA